MNKVDILQAIQALLAQIKTATTDDPKLRRWSRDQLVTMCDEELLPPSDA